MAYNAHTWATGEVITADQLNALEQGAATIAGVADTAAAAVSAATDVNTPNAIVKRSAGGYVGFQGVSAADQPVAGSDLTRKDYVDNTVAARNTVVPQPLASATYYYPVSQVSQGVSAGLGVGTLRLAPFVAPASFTVVRLGMTVTAAGDATAVFRPGIYADNGGKPGALVVDGGAVACNAIAVNEVTVSVPLTAGSLYWIGGVLTVAVTQPTIETISTGPGAAVWMAMGTTKPTAGTTGVGYSMGGVTTTLPSTFTVANAAGATPRIFIRTA